MIRTLLEKKVERILNHYLKLDPESSTHLEKLTGKIVQIEFEPTGIAVQCVFTDTKIKIDSSCALGADTCIKGSPLSLINMAASKDRKHFFKSAIQVEGNIELAQKVMELIDSLDIDWEDHLSRWIGDSPAHEVIKLFRRIHRFNKNASHTFLKNINEYIHEEKMLFPAKEALNDFFHDIDILRMDADRLEKKIEQLIRDNSINKEDTL